MSFMAVARRMVSMNKLRYQGHGFDLDLAYITSRIIAMGAPSQVRLVRMLIGRHG
jgi:phosphatidylinositol-3,4,5-trisphosphate 3-phosphatase/dual-specificity protein phosphatase PTEN